MECTREESLKISQLSSEVMMKLYGADNSGRLLYLFVSRLYDISRLKGYPIEDKYKFVVVKKDEYDTLKND